MVGSSILKKLKEKGYKNLLVVDKKIKFVRSKKVYKYLAKKTKFSYYRCCKSRGILANSKYKDKFLYENLQIQK